MKIERNAITAIIGPSGCGKSTLLRAFNRMNELYAGTSIKGEVTFNGQDIYAREVDPVEVRYRIGMVFQKAQSLPQKHL
jgi:phosphate transport system ATP-binding protein